MARVRRKDGACGIRLLWIYKSICNAGHHNCVICKMLDNVIMMMLLMLWRRVVHVELLLKYALTGL
jgi:hypothetical protein